MNVYVATWEDGSISVFNCDSKDLAITIDGEGDISKVKRIQKVRSYESGNFRLTTKVVTDKKGKSSIKPDCEFGLISVKKPK
jgi:hypothetical protein